MNIGVFSCGVMSHEDMVNDAIAHAEERRQRKNENERHAREYAHATGRLSTTYAAIRNTRLGNNE